MTRAQFFKSLIGLTAASVVARLIPVDPQEGHVFNVEILQRRLDFLKKKNQSLFSGYDIYDRDFHKKLIKKFPRNSAQLYIDSRKRATQPLMVDRHRYCFMEDNPAALERIAKALRNG